jgi:hypothetical protein
VYYRLKDSIFTDSALGCYRFSALEIYDSYEKIKKYIFFRVFQRSRKNVRKFQNFQKNDGLWSAKNRCYQRILPKFLVPIKIFLFGQLFFELSPL